MAVKKSTKKFVKNRLKETIKRRKDKPKTFKKNPRAEKEQEQVAEEVLSNEESSDDEEGLDSFVGDDSVPSSDEEDADETSEDDDSEDEFVENEQDESATDKKQRLKRQTQQHKKQLEEMKEKDPEFFKYLQENDANLLEFGGSDDEEERDDEEEDHGEDDEEMQEDHRQVVTKEMIQNWKSLMIEKKSMNATKQLLKAFKAAVTAGESSQDQSTIKYKVDESAIMNLIVLVTLKHVPGILFDFLKFDSTLSKQLPSHSNKWKKVSKIVKGFVSNTLKLLKQQTESSVLGFILREISKCLPLIACFPPLVKQFIKHCTLVWSGSSHEKVRIQAFLALRKLASSYPNSHLDSIFKTCYLAFQSSCRTVNSHTVPSIQFMSSSLVELYGLKATSAYNFGFVYIRQLAILLRNATTLKTKEAFKKCFNWSFINCASVWAQVICSYCDLQTGVESGEHVRPLIYPLVQVILGLMTLKNGSRHYPFRFHCIRILLEIINRTGTFIPVGSFLLDVFESSEIKSKPKPSTLKPMEMKLTLKVPTNYLKTRPLQAQLIDETVQLMFEYYASFAMHIGFPELAIPAIFQMKRLIKITKSAHLTKQLNPLIEKVGNMNYEWINHEIQENCLFIEKKRSLVEFSPKDLDQALHFLDHIDPMESPLYKYTQTRIKFKLNQQETKNNQPQTEDEDKLLKKQVKSVLGKLTAPSPIAMDTLDSQISSQNIHDLEDDIVEEFTMSDDEDDE